MALVDFKIYTDAGLTTELAGNIVTVHNNDGTTGDIDRSYYIGSTVAGKTLQTAVNGGVDQIVLSLLDSNVAAGTPDVTDFKLALTLLGLDSAIAGAAIDLGTTILADVANALPFYVRISQPAAAGIEISIETNNLEEL